MSEPSDSCQIPCEKSESSTGNMWFAWRDAFASSYFVSERRFKLINKIYTLQWRHDGRNSVSNHQSHDCLLNRLFRRWSKKTSKLRVTGLCEGNSPGTTGEFPAQMVSNAANVSISWRHHGEAINNDLPSLTDKFRIVSCIRNSW